MTIVILILCDCIMRLQKQYPQLVSVRAVYVSLSRKLALIITHSQHHVSHCRKGSLAYHFFLLRTYYLTLLQFFLTSEAELLLL